MYQVADEDELEPVVEQKKVNVDDFAEYVVAHQVSQAASKTKKQCRERIEQTMIDQKQKVVTVGEDFFVRGEKVTRMALTLPFIKQGFLSFFRKCKNMQVTAEEADEFVKYLEAERDQHGVRKKATVKYSKKRPPEAYFY